MGRWYIIDKIVGVSMILTNGKLSSGKYIIRCLESRARVLRYVSLREIRIANSISEMELIQPGFSSKF